jgi:DNA-directed RNA polymerase specialized sigma24 family protein
MITIALTRNEAYALLDYAERAVKQRHYDLFESPEANPDPDSIEEFEKSSALAASAIEKILKALPP